MLRFFAGRGVSRVTVNTQADNARSQSLYKRYGFEFTGYSVPVWLLDLH
jgi:ribosomal protein S18 acetylase RimI-like enzyme